jgi:branched-chain amino acid transport system permease protein
MYSLVALGFVLIYKASGVFNFAQGAMVYFAALAVVGLMEKGMPMWAAIIGAFVVMILVGLATERFVLRKLVNQPPITLFMATIGLTFFLEGLGPAVRQRSAALDLGIVDEPIQSVMDNSASASPSSTCSPPAWRRRWWRRWRCSSRRPRSAARCARWPTTTRPRCRSAFRCSTSGPWCGRGRFRGAGGRHAVGLAQWRAVRADLDGAQGLPVLILGGFTSVPGAIVGGLIIGASEKLAEIYIPPVMQDAFGGNFGGIEGWFPTCWRCCSCWCGRKAVRRAHIDRNVSS